MRVSRKMIAVEYSYSISTVDRRIAEIKNLIGTRYPKNAIIKYPVRIRKDVLTDYLENRQMIIAGIAPAFTGGNYEK